MASRTRSAALVVALVACGRPAEKAPPKQEPALGKLAFPSGWTADYDATSDRWLVTSAAGSVRISRAPEGSVASPDAFLHARDIGAPVVKRGAIRDGFVVTTATDAFVVRHISNVWAVCEGPPEPELVELCATYSIAK